MSTTVDKRVVSMQFDNARFEKNIKQSSESLDEFRKKLRFDDEIESMDELEDRVDKLDMSGLEKNTKKVTIAFNALQVAASTAVATITNKVVNTLTNYLDQMSAIKNITAGWASYEEQLVSTQIILNSIKSSYESEAEAMEEVQEKMEQLRWFADETSYSIDGMTSSLGKFLSAGVELDEAIDAVQGVSAWAALEGQNSTTAIHVATQLAQALGRNVNAQDWSSIESANMASEAFKEQVLNIASSVDIMGEGNTTVKKVVSTLADGSESIKYYLSSTVSSATSEYAAIRNLASSVDEDVNGTEITMSNFRSLLSEGFFTGDMLSKVLKEYGKFSTRLNEVNTEIGDNAPIMTKWRKFFSAYEEAGKNSNRFWKLLEDSAGEAGNSYSDLLEIFNETGLEQEDFISYLKELTSEEYEFSRSAAFAAQEAKTFTEAIEATKTGVKSQWATIFEVIFGGYLEARDLFTSLSEYLYDVFVAPVGNLADVFTKWADAEEEAMNSGTETNGGYNSIVQSFVNLARAVEAIVEPIKEAWGSVFGEFDENKLRNIIEAIESFTEKLILPENLQNGIKSFATILFKMLQKTLQILKQIWTFVKPIIKAIASVVDMILDCVAALFDLFASLFEVGESADETADATEGVNEELSNMQIIAEALSKALETILNVLTKLKEMFLSLVKKIQESETLSAIVHGLATAISWIVDKFADLVEWGTNIGLWDSIGSGIEWLIDKFTSLFNLVKDGTSSMTSKLSGFGSSIIESLTTPFTTTTTTIETESEKIVSATGNTAKGMSAALSGETKYRSVADVVGSDDLDAISSYEPAFSASALKVWEAGKVGSTVTDTNGVHWTCAQGLNGPIWMETALLQTSKGSSSGSSTSSGVSGMSYKTMRQVEDADTSVESEADKATDVAEDTAKTMVTTEQTSVDAMTVISTAFAYNMMVIADLMEKLFNPTYLSALAASIVEVAIAIMFLRLSLGRTLSIFSAMLKITNVKITPMSAGATWGIFGGIAIILGELIGLIYMISKLNMTESMIDNAQRLFIMIGIMLGGVLVLIGVLELVVKGYNKISGKIGNTKSKSKNLLGKNKNNIINGEFSGSQVASSDDLFLTLLGVAAIIAAFAWMGTILVDKDVSAEKLKAFSKVLLAMSLALAVIFGCLIAIEAVIKSWSSIEGSISFSKNPFSGKKSYADTTDSLFLSLLGIAAIIFAFSSIISPLTKEGVDESQIKAISLVILAMSASLAIIFGSLIAIEAIIKTVDDSKGKTGLSGTTTDNLLKTFLGVALIMAAFALVIKILADANLTVNRYKAIANVLVALSIAFGVIFAGIIALEAVINKYKGVSHAADLTTTAGALLKFGGAMAIIAIAFGILAAILKNNDITIGWFATALLGVLGSTLIVAVFAVGISHIEKRYNISGLGGSLLKFAASLLLVTAAISAIVGVLIGLSAITKVLGPTNVLGAAVALILVVGTLGVMMSLISVLDINTDKMLDFAASMTILSVALIAIAGALLMLQGWSFESGWQGLLGAGIVLVAIGGICKAFDALKINESVLKVAFSFLALSAALIPIALALQMTANIISSGGNMFASIGNLVATMVVVGGGLWLVSKIFAKVDAVQLLKTVGAMAALAGVLVIMAVGLKIAAPGLATIIDSFKDMSAGQIIAIGGALLTMALGIGAILGVLMVGGLIGQSIPRLLKSMKKIAVILALVSVSIWAIASAVESLVNAIQMLRENMPTAVEVQAALDIMFIALNGFISKLIYLLQTCKNKIVQLTYLIFETLGDMLIVGVMSLLGKLTNTSFINYVATTLTVAAVDIVEVVLEYVIPLILDAIDGIFDYMTNKLVNWWGDTMGVSSLALANYELAANALPGAETGTGTVHDAYDLTEEHVKEVIDGAKNGKTYFKSADKQIAKYLDYDENGAIYLKIGNGKYYTYDQFMELYSSDEGGKTAERAAFSSHTADSKSDALAAAKQAKQALIDSGLVSDSSSSITSIFDTESFMDSMTEKLGNMTSSVLTSLGLTSDNLVGDSGGSGTNEYAAIRLASKVASTEATEEEKEYTEAELKRIQEQQARQDQLEKELAELKAQRAADEAAVKAGASSEQSMVSNTINITVNSGDDPKETADAIAEATTSSIQDLWRTWGTAPKTNLNAPWAKNN